MSPFSLVASSKNIAKSEASDKNLLGHPVINGFAECNVQTLKQRLKSKNPNPMEKKV